MHGRGASAAVLAVGVPAGVTACGSGSGSGSAAVFRPAGSLPSQRAQTAPLPTARSISGPSSGP